MFSLAPEHLDEYEKSVWVEIKSLLHDGITGTADKLAFERFVRLYALSRTAEKFSAALEANLRAYFAMFGMSPADRSRVKLPEQPKGNSFADL